MADNKKDTKEVKLREGVLQAASGGVGATLGTLGLGSSVGMVTGVQPMYIRGMDPDIKPAGVHAMPGQPVFLNPSPMNYVVNEALDMPAKLVDESTNDYFPVRKGFAVVPRGIADMDIAPHYHKNPLARAVQFFAGPQEVIEGGHVPDYMRVGSDDFDIKRILRETGEAWPDYVKNNKLRVAAGIGLGALGANAIHSHAANAVDGLGKIQEAREKRGGLSRIVREKK